MYPCGAITGDPNGSRKSLPVFIFVGVIFLFIEKMVHRICGEEVDSCGGVCSEIIEEIISCKDSGNKFNPLVDGDDDDT